MGNKAAKRQQALADQQRADEVARQERIRAGTADINRIFDGGTFGIGRIGASAAFDPNGTYFRADGTQWTPSARLVKASRSGKLSQTDEGLTPSSGPAPVMAHFRKSPFDEWKSALDAGLFTGSETRPGQFTDDFFNRQAQSYVDYARPQVDEQAGKARDQLTFALARNGTLDSSMRSTQNADLQRAVDRQLLDITDRGREYATTARNNVEQARADLIANLTMTGDNVGASNAALARAEALAAPPAYSPLGQLFTDYTAGLAQQAAFERSQALGLGPRPSGGATLYNNPRAVTVRR